MYLDWNATAPMDPTVQKMYWEAMQKHWGNVHSQHRLGRDTAVAVELAREQVAAKVGVHPQKVRFTSGATEANSWVLSYFSRRGKVLTSAIEHPSVAEWRTDKVSVNAQGVVELEDLKQKLEQGGVALVSVMAANNETGVLQPIHQVYEICRAYKVPYHCDASQVYGRMEIQIRADFITLSAHKFGGPKGVGMLIVEQELPPLLRGGPQERGTRAGTLNAPGVIATGFAMERCSSMTFEEQNLLEAALKSIGGQIIGEHAPRLPNTTCALFSVPGDMLVMALDMNGIQTSTGAACSSGSSMDSVVLQEMGLQGKPVRFSWGPKSSLREVLDTIINTIEPMGETCEW